MLCFFPTTKLLRKKKFVSNNFASLIEWVWNLKISEIKFTLPIREGRETTAGPGLAVSAAMGPRLLVGVQGFWRTPIGVSQINDCLISEDSVRIGPMFDLLRKLPWVSTLKYGIH